MALLNVLGTAQLTRPYGALGARRTDRDPAEAEALLRLAESSGFHALDTAPSYGDAESVIGRSGTRLAIHTKLAPVTDPTTSVTRSLELVGRSQLDVLYVHDATLVLDDPEDVIGRAASLVGETVDRLGISVYEPEEFDAAVADGRFAVIQIPYNLVDRRFGPETVAAAAARDIRVLARSALLQGILIASPESLPPDVAHLAEVPRQLHRLAARFGRSPLELALGWVRAHGGISGLVLGAESTRQLRELGGALLADPLTESELRLLRTLDVPDAAEADPRIWAPEALVPPRDGTVRSADHPGNRGEPR